MLFPGKILKSNLTALSRNWETLRNYGDVWIVAVQKLTEILRHCTIVLSAVVSIYRLNGMYPSIVYAFREELDDEEYEETREDTLSQLKEFQESLKSVAGGNMSLVDSIGAMNLVHVNIVKHMFRMQLILFCNSV